MRSRRLERGTCVSLRVCAWVSVGGRLRDFPEASGHCPEIIDFSSAGGRVYWLYFTMILWSNSCFLKLCSPEQKLLIHYIKSLHAQNTHNNVCLHKQTFTNIGSNSVKGIETASWEWVIHEQSRDKKHRHFFGGGRSSWEERIDCSWKWEMGQNNLGVCIL